MNPISQHTGVTVSFRVSQVTRPQSSPQARMIQRVSGCEPGGAHQLVRHPARGKLKKVRNVVTKRGGGVAGCDVVECPLVSG